MDLFLNIQSKNKQKKICFLVHENKYVENENKFPDAHMVGSSLFVS
jgi:hypothetical protein